MLRIAAGCLLVLACRFTPEPAYGDGGDDDDGEPDVTAPKLVTLTPAAGNAWLHAPVRLRFDERIVIDHATATATLAGAAVDTAITLEDPVTAVVTLAPSLRGVGKIAIRIDGITDRAGNPAAPIEVALDAPAWATTSSDRGIATVSPRIVASDAGIITAAWLVGTAGSRRVAVARVDGEWQPLGELLGDGEVTAVATALDAMGRPVVAWSEAGVVRAARWTGAWAALPSPGAGTQVALAAGGGGDPIVAAFGSTVAVARLAGDDWQPLGDLPLGGVVGEPALAADGSDRIAVGWIDAGAELRVARFDGTWSAIAPIALGASPTGSDHLSLAIRGDTIAVAWDQWAGSFGVLAAIATGQTWQPLGHLLDVDPAGDALAPAIAIDDGGAPIVAWTELIEGTRRGVVARWVTDRWTIVGGHSFGDAGAPTPPVLALFARAVPVVAWTADGAIAVARFNGPATAAAGMTTRTSLAGCAITATAFPALLSQTGCFTFSAPCVPTPHPGLVPYDIVSELWTDGAKKRRWIALPDDATLTASSTGAWAAPAGTFIVKEFALETHPGDPTSRRAIETRFLVNDPLLGWQGASYRWTSDGSDATLQPDTSAIVDWPMADGSTHAHYYPSRSQCLSCHEGSYGPLLGIRPEQLARWFDYGGVIADQAATLAALGIVPASTAQPFIAPHDPSATAEQRTRGYMAANCAHCHNPSHIAILDLRYPTPLADTHLCDKIVPGSPPQSIVYARVSQRPGMPPLGSLAVDPVPVALLDRWITGMTSCP